MTSNHPAMRFGRCLVAAIIVTMMAGGVSQAQTSLATGQSGTQILMYTESIGQLWDGFQGVWPTPLADDAPIDPESANLVAVLHRFFPGSSGRRANFSINSGGYLYVATPTTPYVKVTLDPGKPYQAALQNVFNQVPFPANAQPSPDTDHRMAILQPSTGCFWDFWHLVLATDGSGWHAGWGGRDCGVLTDPGVYQNVQDTLGNSLEQSNWGAPASGFPLMGGAMMVDELAHGQVPHALSFALDRSANCAGLWNQPAERTDGGATPIFDANGEPTNCVPEGARFRLPPPCPDGTPSTPGVCYNVSDLASAPPIVQQMAAAAQTYGMIDVNSTRGGGVSVESGDAQGAPYQVLGANPYTTAIAGEPNTPFLGKYTNQNALALFPWTWLELVQMNVTSTPNATTYFEPDPPAPLWPTN